MKKKISPKFILKYFALFFISLVLANAEINSLSPFLFAFFFACIYVGLDEKLLAIFTLSSALVISPNLESFYISLTVVAVGLVVYYFHRLIKCRLRLITLFISYLFSLATYIYYNFADIRNVIFYVLLGLISLYVFIVVLYVLSRDHLKLTLDESACALFALAIIGVGLSSVYIFEFAVYRLVLAFMIFICVAIGSPILTFSLTLSFSLGVSIAEMNLLYMAEFALIALFASIFSMPNKFKIVIMSLIAEAFIQLYFNMSGIGNLYSILPIVVAGVIFIILPNRALNSLADIIYVKKSELSSRNLINSSRKSMRRRLSELSNVFNDMKELHMNMVKRQLSKEELIAMLTREITNSCCRDCLDKNRCTRSLGIDNKSNLEELVEIAVTKGKITLLDIPPALTNRCMKVNNLITLLNHLVDEYSQYKSMLTDINNVKILLADQMGAVSRLLLDIGEEIDTNATFDIARENKIISRLLAQNIDCKEVLLYSEKGNELSAVIISKAESVNAPIIEKVVSETLKTPMRITDISNTDESDYSSFTLRRRAKFDCIFGLASCNKGQNEECGDAHSIIRLSSNRFLLALCDGMGSGKSAHKMSAMTLGLIENFYKAGFNNDIILESVNKLLSINNQESYSTLDVCLLDLNHEIADFIKVGAPYGLIKRDGNVDIVQGGALPIGALDSISPSTYKSSVSTKDLIILCTDGITDAFITKENMVEYVSHLANTNPQSVAEAILNEALRLNEMNAKDDMTVLVARTYLKD